MVRPRFKSSPGKDTIVIVEFVSKHGHPGFGGTSIGDASTKLPHVGHCGEILDDLLNGTNSCNKMATTAPS